MHIEGFYCMQCLGVSARVNSSHEQQLYYMTDLH